MAQTDKELLQQLCEQYDISFDKVEKLFGMSITIVSSAKSDEEGKALLEAFGMPFKK